MNETLKAQLTEVEVFAALKDLPTGKAPGRDGLPVEFFVKCWDWTCDDLMEVFNEAVNSKTLCEELNTGLLCLLPKGGCKTNLKNWRPITLLGTVYKLLAKPMARRLQPMLNDIIRPNQTRFIKGRSIIDNVFLAFETMDWAVESQQPMVMLLLDFEKAYDRVEWKFLEGTMQALGFDGQWILWTRALYQDSWCSVRINGATSAPFKLTRSVRQGCPLAPFLYLFIADCLGYLLESDEGVVGILLPGHRSSVTDQEFADDTNLYLQGTLENLDRAKRALGIFALAAGAQINWNKSHAI